jgi:hypothetical protein
VHEFTIRSNRRTDQLRLWVLAPGRLWRARIDFGDLTAEGDREWESLGLQLVARHDGLGHVTLDATLQADYAAEEDRWQVRASLSVDAGSLDRLATEARVLDRR